MQQMGIAEAEDYLAFVLAAYDLASTDAEKSESRKEWNGARHVWKGGLKTYRNETGPRDR